MVLADFVFPLVALYQSRKVDTKNNYFVFVFSKVDTGHIFTEAGFSKVDTENIFQPLSFSKVDTVSGCASHSYLDFSSTRLLSENTLRNLLTIL